MKIRFILLLVTGLAISMAEGQVLPVLDNYGSTGMERAHNIAVDADGNTYVTGWFTSPTLNIGGIILTNSGGGATRDVFVVKYDPAGVPVWAVSAYGPNADDYGNDIAVDDEFVYVTGSFEYDGIYFESSSPLPNSGGSDFFIACFKQTAGSHVWSFTNNASPDNGVLNEYGEGIAVNDDGELYFTGSFNSDNLDIGSISLTNSNPSSGTYDIMMGKVNVTGAMYSVLSVENPLGDGDDFGKDICEDRAGNVFVTGYFYSEQLAFDPSVVLINTDIAGATSDIFTAHYNAGTCLWADNPSGEGDDYALGIETNGTSVYITGGYMSPELNFWGTTSAISNPATMYADYFLAKYDVAAAMPLWVKTADANNSPQWNFDDYGRDLAIDSDGFVYVTGWYNSYEINYGRGIITNETNNNYAEAVVAKYDRLGHLHWVESAHGIYNDQGMGVAVNSADGCCVITGWYESDPWQFCSHTKSLANPVEVSDFYTGRSCGYDCSVSCEYPLEILNTGGGDIGDPDPVWRVTEDPSGGTVPRAAEVCVWHSGTWSYGFPFAGSDWISIDSMPIATTGIYKFEREFIIPDSCINPMVHLCILADDSVEVFINDISVASGGGLFTPLHVDVSGWSGFVVGVNVLRIAVHNTIPSMMAFDLKGSVCCEDITTGVGEIRQDSPDIPVQVIPNPATKRIRIKHTKDISRAEVYSITGQLLIAVDMKNESYIDIERLIPGMYLIMVEDLQGNMTTGKFIKE
ncbi:MAG: hypothetical protein C0593_07370 [Marinilabiliales bacterium]|nr:MAG: hypothetical protein C0593_07370 [Marinilabiliales bacterium]